MDSSCPRLLLDPESSDNHDIGSCIDESVASDSKDSSQVLNRPECNRKTKVVSVSSSHAVFLNRLDWGE